MAFYLASQQMSTAFWHHFALRGTRDRLVGDGHPDGVGVDAGEDADSDPARLGDVDLGGGRLGLPIGFNLPAVDNDSMTDEVDGDGAGPADAAALDVPIGLRIEAGGSDAFSLRCRLLDEQGSHVEGDLRLASSGKVHLAYPRLRRLAQGHIVDLKIHHMTQPFAAVAATMLESLAPDIEVERLVFWQLDIDAAQPDLVAIETGEVGLAAEASPHAAVEYVVPDVEFPNHRRIDRRDEVTHAERASHDELIRSDPVERGRASSGRVSAQRPVHPGGAPPDGCGENCRDPSGM